MAKMHGISFFNMTAPTALVVASSNTVGGVTTTTFTDGSTLVSKMTRMGESITFSTDGHDLFSINGLTLPGGQTSLQVLNANGGNMLALFAAGMGGNDLIKASHESDTVRGYGGDDVINGESGNDVIYGDDGNDIINGSAGNDTVWGGNGNDTIGGGNGADRMDGGAGYDVLSFETTKGSVHVDLLVGTAVADGKFTDTIVNFESVLAAAGNDSIYGNNLDNRLMAGGGTDVIDGRGGADLIDGGSGNDVLIGGAGADQFVLAGGGGSDRVVDFTDGGDLIALRGASDLSGVVITDTAAGAKVAFGGANLVLDGVAAADLGAADFIFI